jgi:hypothetical protein
LRKKITTKKTAMNQEFEHDALDREDNLHEIFRHWEQRYTTPQFDPEPFVRR